MSSPRIARPVGVRGHAEDPLFRGAYSLLLNAGMTHLVGIR